MQHAEVIRLVGPEKIRGWFNATGRTLVDWRARGIPSRFWARLIELSAADAGVETITLADLESGSNGKRSARSVSVEPANAA